MEEVGIVPGAFYNSGIALIEKGGYSPRPVVSIRDLSDLAGVVFMGGEDIHPALYGHESIHSSVGRNPSRRDIFESSVYRIAKRAEIRIFGICRGAQLIGYEELKENSNIMFIQNISPDHPGEHRIVRFGKQNEYKVVNSLHHQGLLLLNNNLNTIIPLFIHNGIIEEFVIKGFPVMGVQYHPEIMENTNIFNEFMEGKYDHE